MPQKISDVMTEDLITIGPESSLIDASKQMQGRDIGDVLVVRMTACMAS